MSLTPAQRTMRARLAAQSRWAREDSREGTAKARAGFFARFEREVDPEGVLSPEERSRRADLALKAHMTKMSLQRSKSRKD